MRISALADPGADGLLTESGNRVGEISAGGTGELVLFGGILGGIFAGIAWVMIRPWLSRLGTFRFIGAAAASVAAGSVFVLNAERDFSVLDPAWLNVAMFLTLLALIGAFISAADSWLHAHLPAARGWNSAAYALVVAAGAPLIVPLLGNYFSEDFCGCDNPPRLTGLFLVALGVLTASWWATQIRSGVSGQLDARWLRTAGEIAAGGLIAAGGVYTLQEVMDIV